MTTKPATEIALGDVIILRDGQTTVLVTDNRDVMYIPDVRQICWQYNEQEKYGVYANDEHITVVPNAKT